MYPGAKKKKNRFFTTYYFDDENEKYHIDNCLVKVAIERLNNLLNEYILKKKSFLLMVGFNMPHLPFVTPKRIYKKYENIPSSKLASKWTTMNLGKKINSNLFWKKHSQKHSRYRSLELKQYKRKVSPQSFRKGYYSAVSYLDELVGRLTNHISKNLHNETEKNTIIVFWSDNGYHLGDNSIFCKKTNFEAALQVPLAIKLPQSYLKLHDNVKIMKTINAPVESGDIFPTLFDIIGLYEKLPNTNRTDSNDTDSNTITGGRSMLPLMKNKTTYLRAASVSEYWSHLYGTKGNVMGYSFKTIRYRFIAYLHFNRYDDSTDDKLLQYKLKKSRKTVGKVELYDYKKDGRYEIINRYNNNKYKKVVEWFWKLFENNEDRNWNSLVNKLPIEMQI